MVRIAALNKVIYVIVICVTPAVVVNVTLSFIGDCVLGWRSLPLLLCWFKGPRELATH